MAENLYLNFRYQTLGVGDQNFEFNTLYTTTKKPLNLENIQGHFLVNIEVVYQITLDNGGVFLDALGVG